jgi:hypothetical protein
MVAKAAITAIALTNVSLDDFMDTLPPFRLSANIMVAVQWQTQNT